MKSITAEVVKTWRFTWLLILKRNGRRRNNKIVIIRQKNDKAVGGAVSRRAGSRSDVADTGSTTRALSLGT